ncbi:MAG TPA: glutaredoxin family protein [Bryobacteraceae bacterium]|nr:glutaredoxin family protein [Bryobacteraceae bacterium]
MEKVKVYGADWCGPTRRLMMHLDDLGVAYDYIDVEHDEAASQWVKDQNGGKEKKPTVDIGGKILTSPSMQKLEEVLREEKALA